LCHAFAVGWIVLVFQRLSRGGQRELILFQVMLVIEKCLAQFFIGEGWR